MKNIFLLIALVLASSAYGATCTSTTRNNYVTNQVLTSTALNADFNQLVTKANDFDGGCVTDGTLESTALNSSQFAPLLKGVKEGCFASRSDANTISVDKCLIAVNGTLLDKTTATTVTWGCSGCSSEANSTTYYVYATATSPLTLQILTTAPDAYGYSGTSRVVARFYNNASGDIDSQSVGNWVVNGFTNGPFSEMMKVPNVAKPKTIYYAFGGAGSLSSITPCTGSPCTEYYDSEGTISAPTRGGVGTYDITIPNGTFANTSFVHCTCSTTGGSFDCGGSGFIATGDSGGFATQVRTATQAGAAQDRPASLMCSGLAP